MASKEEIATSLEETSGLWNQSVQEHVEALRAARRTALDNISTAIGIIDGNINALIASSEAAVEGLTADSNKHELAIEEAAKQVRAISTTTTPTTPTPTGFPGQPKTGTIRWGAGIGGNSDPVARHESVAGTNMGIRRTFWDMSKTTSLLNTVKADHAAGRLPWVSVKLGTTWENVAAGKIDGALNTLIKALAATGKPVWFTAHHEPEGGNGTPYPDDGQGTEVHWRNMQKHVSSLIKASGATNIAFAPILMSWTFDPASKRNPLDWWVEGIWDFIGIDNYQDKQAGGAPQTMTMWKNTYNFYKDKGLKIAIGEWGNRGEDAAAANEMVSWYEYLISIGSPGVCYFDSGLNSPSGSWELKGEPLNKFRSLMKDPRSVRTV